VTFHALLLKGLRREKKNSPDIALLKNALIPASDAVGGFSSASRTGNQWSASEFNSIMRPGRLVLFEMSRSTELLAMGRRHFTP
jgi:hypothetical protein